MVVKVEIYFWSFLKMARAKLTVLSETTVQIRDFLSCLLTVLFGTIEIFTLLQTVILLQRTVKLKIFDVTFDMFFSQVVVKMKIDFWQSFFYLR